jgi:hypothetical protein
MNACLAVKILVIDNYDSFVYNLVQYLAQIGARSMSGAMTTRGSRDSGVRHRLRRHFALTWSRYAGRGGAFALTWSEIRRVDCPSSASASGYRPLASLTVASSIELRSCSTARHRLFTMMGSAC